MVDMHGKTAVVTGGTDGLGREAALKLAERGATVLVTGRDRCKGERLLEAIRREHGPDSAELFLADFSSQADVRRLARAIADEHDRLDVLVNNAGLAVPDRRLTDDGVELTFAVNYLAAFLLTHELFPRLRAAGRSRVVNVSSGTHRSGTIDFDDLDRAAGYTWLDAYKQSKLALVLFTYELARRLDGTGVTVNCLEPGPVPGTNLGREYPWYVRAAFGLWSRLPGGLVRKPAAVADAYVYLAASPDVEGVTGTYFADDRPTRSAPETYDVGVQRRLWDASVELTGVLPEQLPTA